MGMGQGTGQGWELAQGIGAFLAHQSQVSGAAFRIGS